MTARWLLGAAVATGIARAGYGRGALSGDGALAATALGTWVFGRGGLPAAAALVAFFVSSSALTRLKVREKARRGVLAQAKGGRRDAWQVLANGGPAAAALLAPRHPGGYLGGVAAAAADTWATELGLLAPGRPRLVTTLRAVAPGTSGAVTTQGLLAAGAGSLAVGAAWALFQPVDRARAVRTAATAGVVGSLLDSALGATVQASYRCLACDEPCETPRHARCESPAELRRGWRWMDNDAVNAIATLGGTLVGSLAWRVTAQPEAHG